MNKEADGSTSLALSPVLERCRTLRPFVDDSQKKRSLTATASLSSRVKLYKHKSEAY